MVWVYCVGVSFGVWVVCVVLMLLFGVFMMVVNNVDSFILVCFRCLVIVLCFWVCVAYGLFVFYCYCCLFCVRD